MNRFLMLLGTVMFMGYVAGGQTGDLGARIAAEDAQLGAQPGEIHVTASGTISEGKVSLSTGHDLVCDNQVIISLNAGSYLYQNSETRIKNCIISSTSTPIAGEIQSVNTDHLELDSVTFVGGGNLVYWSGVTGFLISDNTVVSITAVNAATQSPQGGYYLLSCSDGLIDNLTSNGFVFPAGVNYTGILQLNLSNQITINNPMIHGVDASYIRNGAAVVQIDGSTNVTINGGSITNNAHMDGVLSESSGGKTPSSYITISGLNASYDGALGLNKDAGLNLGDGLDIINTSHVRVSHCTLNGNGNPNNQQPGIWLFIDDDVEVADSDSSENSAAGIAAAGTPNVRLLRDTINRNQASGVFSEWQGGTATNVGPTVTFVTGPSGGFGLDWLPGTPILLDGATYQIASVTDSGHLTLTTSPPDHSSPVSVGVNTTEDIVDTIINDNGVGRWSGKFGEQYQVGITWADGTTGTISGVMDFNTGIGEQLYGLELANTASVALSNDNFLGNLLALDGVDASPQGASSTSLSFPSQAVTTTSSAQTIQLWAGAVIVQNLLIQASDNFSQTNNCGTGLAAFAKCQIQVTFTPTAAGSLNGTLTITDDAPHNPQTISLTGTGLAPGLGLTIATGGSKSASVAAGSTAKYLLSIGGSGIGGMASLSCTGAPLGATCSLPATESVSASQPIAFAVTVTTLAPAMGMLGSAGFRHVSWLWGLAILGWVTLPARLRTKHRARRYPVSLLLLLLALCSCGGRGSTATPPGDYTLTIAAKIGSTSEQIPLTLTLQ